MNEYQKIICNIFLDGIDEINKRSNKKVDINSIKRAANIDIEKDKELKDIIKNSKKLSYSIDKYSLETANVNQVEKVQAPEPTNGKKKKSKHNHKNKSKGKNASKAGNVNTVNTNVSSETVLQSIFNVFRKDIDSKPTSYKLNTGEKTFVMPTDASIKNEKSDYASIVTSINKNVNELMKSENLNSLIYFLEKTMNTAPCKTNGEEIYDISLYDNVKLMAALSGCEYYYSKEESKESNNATEKYLLVSADVSGIQSFIYTIASKGALRALRGRSFYLEIVVENIIDEILEKIGLCRANLLYSGGGHFYMLLPNTARVKNIIEEAKFNINQWFLETYSVDLYIEISYVEASENTLLNDTNENLIGKLYRDVGAKNSVGKIRRYSKAQLKQLMFESENSQDDEECSICHKSHKLNEDNICENCSHISELGNNLPRLQGGKGVITIEGTKRDKSLEIPSIEKDKVIYLNYCDGDISKISCIRGYSMNSREILANSKIININAGLYSKKLEDKFSLISFEELAKSSKGVKRLGVLRADVDNLGKAFTEGFELKDSKDKYKYISLSRNSNLSYSLSKFFKLQINDICRGNVENRFNILGGKETEDRNIVIVYAGGDDLFIVGAWNEVVELAVDINKQFKEFTNGKMTLSAGIGIFHSKYPIEQMASNVGELEHIAKANGKNKICLFDSIPENKLEFDSENSYRHIYSWEDFEDSVCGEKIKKMYEWFDFDKDDREKLEVGMSLLYKLLSLVREIKAGERINIARIAYLLGRLEPGKDKKELYIDFKNTFYGWVLDKKDIRELETALTLIIYLNRKEEKDNE